MSAEKFGFLLLPDFPLAPLASAVDVLALTNYVSEKHLYEWCTISPDGPVVQSMNGIQSQADYTIENVPSMYNIVVCSGIGGNRHAMPNVMNWLRKQYSKGLRIGSISTGSWILARAGLLHNRRCTVHWEDISAFQETFPDLNVTSGIFECDGRIFTCSGASAVVDMFLSFVASVHGYELASSVAEQFVHGPLRSDHTHQRLDLKEKSGITNKIVIEAVNVMEKNVEEPVPLGDLAESLGVSNRHLERLFNQHLGKTPRFYYRELRLNRAQSLLRRSTLSIAEIAFATGFCTSSYFSRCYSEYFGHLPTQGRTENLIRH